jgi:hypothetical protein
MGFHTREAIENRIVAANKSPGEFLFGGCGSRDPPITTRQYAWLDSHRIGSIRPLRGSLRPGTEPGLEATAYFGPAKGATARPAPAALLRAVPADQTEGKGE